MLRGFISATKEPKEPIRKAPSWAKVTRMKFVIKTTTGREITKFFKQTHGHEILIMPYTYFFIIKTKYENGMKTYFLKEINMPKTKK